MASSPVNGEPSGNNKSPAFQFYPKDFLTDENVRLMSMQERGIYITLMSYCWIESTLPADTKTLARLCGMPVKQFNNLWRAIAPCFDVDPLHGDRIVHQRLDKERIKQILYLRRQSDKGKASAEKRRLVEQNANRGSTVVQPDTGKEPTPDGKSSSAVCSLQFADSSQHPRKEREGVVRTRTGSGVMAGSLPRDHLRHSWCGRVCVPDFLHGQFEQATGQSSETLKAFYADTFGAIPEDEAVDPDPPRFWRPRVVARWPPKLNGQSLNADGMGVEDLAAAIRDGREKGFYDRRG